MVSASRSPAGCVRGGIHGRRRSWRVALLAPGLLWTLIFFVVPLVVMVVYSFGQIDIITFQTTFGWTLDNYRRLANDIYLHTILRSLEMSIGATIGCLLVGYPVAYTIARQKGRTQTLLLLGVMVPFWTSFVVRTYAWVNLLSNDGLVTRALRGLGLESDSSQLIYTPTAVTIGIVYTYLPLMVLPLYVALERIDPQLLQAASDLGAGWFGRFRRVVLPLSMPGVIAGCILVGVPATGEYVIPAILGGDKTLMYGNVVANQFLKVGDYPFGSALAVSLMLLVTGFLLITRGRLARAEEIT
ncbi:MAG TPA: ABC transporter permease [Gaiellales bacterium]|nr:ABC transporter permease [Gaiellales bacterium]